mgnify:CR=1 FL=1
MITFHLQSFNKGRMHNNHLGFFFNAINIVYDLQLLILFVTAFFVNIIYQSILMQRKLVYIKGVIS